MASIITNHRAPLPLVPKGDIRGGAKCFAPNSNTLRPFTVSKAITFSQRFLNPSTIGSGHIIHRTKIKQTPQPIIVNPCISFTRCQDFFVPTKPPLRWMLYSSGTNPIEINVNKTLNQMFVCFYRRRMIAIQPVKLVDQHKFYPRLTFTTE